MATEYHWPGVYVEEQESGSRPIQGVGTAIAGFVGRTEKAPADANGPVMVANWTQFKEKFGDLTEALVLPFSVYGFFQNGGGSCYVASVGGDAGGARPTVEIPGAGDGEGTVLRATVTDDAAGAVSVEISDPAEGDAAASFDLAVRVGGQEAESHPGLPVKRGQQGAAATVTSASKLVKLDDVGRSGGRPANGTYDLAPPPPAQVGLDDYLGDTEARTGLAGLATIDEVTMLVAPDAVWPSGESREVDLELVGGVQDAMVTQADTLNDRMAILDTPPNLTVQQVRDWKAGQGSLNTMWAAIYWPWIRIFNPLGSSPLAVPPSGHMAGVWGRSDDTRGVHKAPANEPISGVKDLEINVTDDEQGGLNDDGINAIRQFRGRGIRVWGARTATQDALDWQYVNVRRLFNYVEESIEEGTQWVVFEPNDPDLWARITRTVTAFLTTCWRDGMLFGRKAEEAFYVKCDDETNPEESIQKGRVVIEVGLAAVRPAEFVVFRIAQLTRGAQAA